MDRAGLSPKEGARTAAFERGGKVLHPPSPWGSEPHGRGPLPGCPAERRDKRLPAKEPFSESFGLPCEFQNICAHPLPGRGIQFGELGFLGQGVLIIRVRNVLGIPISESRRRGAKPRRRFERGL